MGIPKSKITEIYVEITNWQKYNHRKDVRQNSWFRFDHSVFENPEFDDFTHTDLIVWLYLLCLASKKSTGVLTVYTSHAERIGKISPEDLISGLQKLNKIKAITFRYVTPTSRQRHVDVTSTIVDSKSTTGSTCPTQHNTTVHNTTQHNTTSDDRTDVTSPPSSAPFDFGVIYEIYPRKVAKQEGIQRCIETIKTQEDFDLLYKATERYSAYCKRLSDDTFILHFSTFIEKRRNKPYIQPWRDWLDDKAGTSVVDLKKANGKHLTFQQQRLENTKSAVQEFLGGDLNEEGHFHG